jgi:hypothetical protein
MSSTTTAIGIFSIGLGNNDNKKEMHPSAWNHFLYRTGLSQFCELRHLISEKDLEQVRNVLNYYKREDIYIIEEDIRQFDIELLEWLLEHLGSVLKISKHSFTYYERFRVPKKEKPVVKIPLDSPEF